MSLKTAIFLHFGIGVPLVCLILLPGWAGLKQPPETYGQVPAFELTDHTGAVFRARDLEGRVTVIDFVFTQCRGICPALHAQMQVLRHRFADRADLQLLSISVDPENDTPERMAAFMAEKGLEDARWRFLTGDRADIKRLLEQGLMVGLPDDPQVHSDRFVLVDVEGNLRGSYSLSDSKKFKQLKLDLAKLFKQADLRSREPTETARPISAEDANHDL